MNPVECFNIEILKHNDEFDLFDISNDQPIYKLKCLNSKFSINPTIIEADPFLFVWNKRLYLFYESKTLCNPACIKMVSTDDLNTWTEPIIVLQESFHLSFPYVFVDDGNIYMLPETGENKSVRLYKATDSSLQHFEFYKTLLSEEKDRCIKMSYFDSCIYKHNTNYFLFTSLQYEDEINTLELYYSNELVGPYKKHVLSPIIKSNAIGRNAGSLVSHNDKLFRVSQDCMRRYGDNVNVAEIIDLSNNIYEENLSIKNIIPTNKLPYIEGGHHFNKVKFKGSTIIAIDYKEYHLLLTQRIINKVFRSLSKMI